jgi:Ras-related protein Rab-5C
VGAHFAQKDIVLPFSESKMRLHIWDTAGQEKFSSLNCFYFRDAHAAVIVYDQTNKNSIKGVE